MNKLFILALLLVLLAPSLAVAAEIQGHGDCVSCHKLSLEEAGTLLKEVGQVKEVIPSAVKGLWEVVVEKDGRKARVLVNYGKTHAMPGPVFPLAAKPAGCGILPTATSAPERAAAPAPAPAPAASSGLVIGNAKGKKQILVFTDPDCPFCARFHPQLKRLAEMDPEIGIFIKLFPLPMHRTAMAKSRVIVGANSLALLERAYAGESLPEPGANDTAEAVDAEKKLGESLGVTSTPTVVLPSGRLLPGARSAEELKRLIDGNQ